MNKESKIIKASKLLLNGDENEATNAINSILEKIELEDKYVKNKARYFELIGLISNAKYNEDTHIFETERDEIKLWLNENMPLVKEELR